MEKRNLGRSGIKVSPFALGGNVFGWTVKESGFWYFWMNLFVLVSI